MKERFNIAYMGSHKYEGYPVGLENGVKNGLYELDQNLIWIADLLPIDFIDTSPYYFRLAFELAARMDIDCYIVPVGMINSYNVANNEINGRVVTSILDPRRTIVIEDVFPGYRYITKDNKPGMRELMIHMLEKHKYKRICFISGPESSFGARERESVYFEEMEKHGLSVDDKMFARGIFSGACDEVVEELLYNNPDAEAIVCANDHIAMTVYRVLRSHNLSPGVDVAVTGFDDDPGSLHATPPLTTVRIASYDLGYAAAYEAVRLCKDQPQEINILNSRFIHRISCGETKNTNINPYANLLKQSLDLDAITRQFLDDILDSSSEQIREMCWQRIHRLSEKIPAVLDESKPYGSEHLIDTTDIVDIFRYDAANYISYKKFQSAVSTCFDSVSQFVSDKRRNWLNLEAAYFHQLISDNIQSMYVQREWDSRSRQWSISRIISDAIVHSDNPKLAIQEMFQALTEMGIKDAYLLEFAEPVEFLNKSKLLLNDTLYLRGQIKDSKFSYSDGRKRYMLQQIIKTFLPDSLSDGERLMTSPAYTIGALTTGTEALGLLILGPCMLQSGEIIHTYSQIAFGLKHLHMIRQEKELISILNRNNLKLSQQSEHDELTGLYNRRGFMHSLERRLNEALRSNVKYESDNSESASESDNHTIKATIYFMDLDGLKQINDTYGHDDGDFAIITTARILEEAFNNSLVGRLGGDEYLGFRFTRKNDSDNGAWMISHIERIMERYNMSINKPYKLAISVGYHTFDVTNDTWDKIPAILDEADSMLYKNKRSRKAK